MINDKFFVFIYYTIFRLKQITIWELCCKKNLNYEFLFVSNFFMFRVFGIFGDKMAFTQSLGTFIVAVILSLFIVNLNIETCNSQQLNSVNDFAGAHAYTPDTGLLDFVYHNHDDMTRFLR